VGKNIYIVKNKEVLGKKIRYWKKKWKKYNGKKLYK